MSGPTVGVVIHGPYTTEILFKNAKMYCAPPLLYGLFLILPHHHLVHHHSSVLVVVLALLLLLGLFFFLLFF